MPILLFVVLSGAAFGSAKLALPARFQAALLAAGIGVAAYGLCANRSDSHGFKALAGGICVTTVAVITITTGHWKQRPDTSSPSHAAVGSPSPTSTNALPLPPSPVSPFVQPRPSTLRPGCTSSTPNLAPPELNSATRFPYSVVLQWKPPADNGCGVWKYSLRRGGSEIATTSQLSFEDRGLQSTFGYSYSLVAIDNRGDEHRSTPSSDLNVRTAQKPGGLHITVDPPEVRIGTGFRVKISNVAWDGLQHDSMVGLYLKIDDGASVAIGTSRPTLEGSADITAQWVTGTDFVKATSGADGKVTPGPHELLIQVQSMPTCQLPGVWCEKTITVNFTVASTP